MITVHPGDIIVSARQRKKFETGPLSELEDSIQSVGILQPPVVRFHKGKFSLVAGERRVRAMSNLIDLDIQIKYGDVLLPRGTLPAYCLGVMSDMLAFEAELDENIKRENLTWQERAQAESALMELRTLQNEEQGLPPPTLTAIASEIVQRTSPDAGAALGSAITSTANRIRLAEHLHDPEVARAKTSAEAIKIVKRKQETEKVATLAKAFESSTSGESPHTLLQGDCRLHLPNIADHSVDVLLTDPPYGIDADTFGEQSGTGHNYADSEEYFNELIGVLADESYRFCKASAHAYIFCDPRRFADIQLAFDMAGWKVWPIPLIWAKGNGMLPRPDHAPRRTYEAILFATKGERPVRCVKGDVISISSVRDLKHGAQKPVDLYADLLSRSVVPGNTVLDAFAGSGTIFPAANRARVKAIGIELEQDNYNLCLLRMAGEEDSIPGLEDIDL